ncbi:hypothetical protein CCR87_07975 [Rhodobaculum claviforme]|uniref:Uncharacterized protein n=1 Tax=Rhodobaculum claviforme TaxID=1549854 RepID=A0A934TJJ5_9RHOB|nr:hypothetical protein [Rhodobaculum claviforme]
MALFKDAVDKDVVSRAWRKIKVDRDPWCALSLADEDMVRLIFDGTVVRARLDKKATNISVPSTTHCTGLDQRKLRRQDTAPRAFPTTCSRGRPDLRIGTTTPRLTSAIPTGSSRGPTALAAAMVKPAATRIAQETTRPIHAATHCRRLGPRWSGVMGSA